MEEDLKSPEGIEQRHIRDPQRRGSSLPFGVLGLAVLLVASVLGAFGTEARVSKSAGGAELTVDAPIRIRNGEFYEMVFEITAEDAIADLVLLVEPGVWRDVTVNTFIPAPTEETTLDGAFAFSFGPLEAGERFEVKVDAQVNPDHTPSANEGRISVADGDETLATVEYRLEVLP